MTPMQRLERVLFDPQRPSRTPSQELAATLGITRAAADALVASGELSSSALATVSAEHDLSIHWIVTGEGPEIASRLSESAGNGGQGVENPGHLETRDEFIERVKALNDAGRDMVLGLLQLPIAFAEGDHTLEELFECAAMLLRVPAAKAPANSDLMAPFWVLATSCVRAYLVHHPRASMRRARALARTRLGEFVGAA